MVHPFGSMSCLQPSLASPNHAHNLEITILIPDPALPQQLLSSSFAITPAAFRVMLDSNADVQQLERLGAGSSQRQLGLSASSGVENVWRTGSQYSGTGPFAQDRPLRVREPRPIRDAVSPSNLIRNPRPAWRDAVLDRRRHLLRRGSAP